MRRARGRAPRSSGRAPGSPAPSTPAPGSRGCRAAAPASSPSRARCDRRELGVEVVGAGEDAADHRRAEPVAAHQLPHDLLGRQEDRVGVVALGLGGPANREESLGGLARSRRGIFPEPRAPRLAESRRASPSASPPSSSDPKPHPRAAPRPGCRPPRPSAAPAGCAPRGSSARSRARRERRTRAGAVGPSSSSTPCAQPAQIDVGGRPAQPHPVGLRHLVARMGEPVRELAVVGQQDQPGRVGVEPADRVEAALRVGPARRPPAPPGLPRGRGHAGRLVQHPDLGRLGRRSGRRPPRTPLVSSTSRAGSVTSRPPTLTRPEAISFSAARREATPLWARYLASARRSGRQLARCSPALSRRSRSSGSSSGVGSKRDGSGSWSRPLSPNRRSNSGVVR